ncbi:MAG: hypothetical protein HYX25_10405 [Candidatus Solibacter usitatus]|nr:hypothetical protein [Candidatus Solibacter usitatus]
MNVWKRLRRAVLGPYRFGAGAPELELTIDLRRAGTALIVEAGTSIETLPKVIVTLLLPWVELAVIAVMVAVGGVVIRFRQPIAGSWLIAEWAAHHVPQAATAIGFLAFVLGCLLAFWKRRQLFVYGVAEVVFGVFSAFQIALLLWPNGDPGKFVALASALYVVSRGAGNVADAVTKEMAIERLRVEVVPGGSPPGGSAVQPLPPSLLGKRAGA